MTMPKKQPQNKKGIEEIKELVKPYPKNAKKHPSKQILLIAKSIEHFGWQQPIKIGKEGYIIVGHGRFLAWQASDKLQEEEPWVINEEGITILGGSEKRKLSSAEEKAYRLGDNKINESDWDMELVIEELKFINETGEVDIDVTGFDKDLILEADELDDEVPELPEEATAKLGDIYQLGEHRVMCGSATITEDVEKLMDGKMANTTFTDPPYLMNFTGNVHGDGTKSLNAKHGKLLNDNLTDEEKIKFLDGFLFNIKKFTLGAYYICWYRLGLHHLFNGIERTSLTYRALIIWDKGNHTLSNSDYQSKYEPIVYGWVDQHKFYGGRSCFDLWKVDRTKANTLHPTMKPVELCSKAITDSTEQNSIVLDLFLGSGSTLIAAQKTGRICYGMELDPKYVDVIIKRWEEYTGEKAILITNK
jgi:DNA modification methylase